MAQKLNSDDHKMFDRIVVFFRILLTPIAIPFAIYIWTWTTVTRYMSIRKDINSRKDKD